MTTYLEKLKDPRWQKKRLEVFERDDWMCQSCQASENTLHIHHRYYNPKTDPWDYPSEALVTLCEDCHEIEKGFWTLYQNRLLRALKKRFLSNELGSIVVGFEKMPIHHAPEVVASVYQWAISNDDIQKELIERFFQQLGNKKRRDNG